ncbi:26S proteasome non-ATPase regulatory subunit 9 [Populus alba x Populus x berolinensis]|uniref:26S proteasome non-ATPase regulatory subunit 9 n=1 Tax=Populus alba x Populus x berolinensis TaxID=444605 RepID=A0AAD6QPH8_9ROSI|nr:26S proteasome non-ATPase regulatory subunit 9 [Populus alba x Populus x berolinensis]KAJ6994104.1 26S proteasome non-ATPase regulatory subunit 9 [Populus alba x Populus x berolinensis]
MRSHPIPSQSRTNKFKDSSQILNSFFFLSSSKKESKKEKKMVGANLKAETMKLMEKRSALETEMNVIIDRLCQPGGPGLSGNLVDSEGFPRSDIDIPVVRAERHRLAELRNDHKEITEKINENIQVLHSARLATKDSVVGNAVPSVTSHNVVLRDSSSSMDVDMMASVPFAVVDEITDASPTAEDGLQLGDQLVKFGTVEYQVGENLLQKLASEAQANQGHAVPVIVMRQGAPINLSVTPRVWPGRGLLGCSFRIL